MFIQDCAKTVKWEQKLTVPLDSFLRSCQLCLSNNLLWIGEKNDGLEFGKKYLKDCRNLMSKWIVNVIEGEHSSLINISELGRDLTGVRYQSLSLHSHCGVIPHVTWPPDGRFRYLNHLNWQLSPTTIGYRY